MMDGRKNLAASVHQRLLNIARREHVEHEYLLLRYANERLLYRLSQSAVRDQFVLKGAMVFLLWGPEMARQSRDIDLLGYGPAAAEHVAEVFRMLCGLEVEEDGLRFDPESVDVREIREQTEYGGLRVQLAAYLGTARTGLRVDVGFGDAVTPEPEESELPTLLDFPPPRLRTYPKETVIAEKFEAMVRLGMTNTRYKDFFDVWMLSRTTGFEGRTLADALQATFERRKTQLPGDTPEFLQAPFADQGERQWRTFCRRVGIENAPGLLALTQDLCAFLMPVCRVITTREPLRRWEPAAGWE